MIKRKERRSNLSTTTTASTSMAMRSTGSHDRKLRYRTILEGFSTLEDEGATMEEKMEYTSSAIREADELLASSTKEERVKHPGENYMASRVLRAAGDVAARCAELVSGNVNAYDRRDLALHIKANPGVWRVQFPREAPPVAFLFGSFDAAPPEERARAPRRRVERQAVGEKRAPATVDKLEKTEQGVELVSRVRRFVQKAHAQRGPLSYFHVVLDPDSFGRSVENIYHLSFLARMGAVAVHLDEESGLPYVTPMAESPPGDISEENQFIVSLDMQRWQELVKAFKIKTPMMVLKRQ